MSSDDDVKPDDSGFDALVERGRSVREHREAREVHDRIKLDDKRARDDQDKRLQIIWYSCSVAGAFTTSMGSYYLMLLSLFGLGPASAIILYLIRPSLLPLFMPVMIGGAVVVFAWSRIAVRRGLERERDWVSRLPFRVTGYEDCLGDRPKDNASKLVLHFVFESAVPPAAVLSDLLSGDGGSWKVDHDVATREPGVDEGYKNYEHNRAFRAWFHAVAEQQLGPLHKAHPFGTLTIDNGRY